MKQTHLFFALLLSVTVFAQGETISPSRENSYCPNVEIIFYVELPSSFGSILGIGGATITAEP
jgi:hypothetical protein